MKKIKLISHIVHLLYLLSSVIFVFKREQLKDFFGIDSFAGYVVYWVVLGLALYFFLWLTDVIESYNLKSKVKNLEAEKNEIKAKLYDREEQNKQEASLLDNDPENKKLE